MEPELLKNVVDELSETLAGCVISKIHQPDERNIILRVFGRGKEHRLLISAHPAFSRMHLTEERFENPPAPKRFCAYLRSRILGARIEGVSQVEGERIARIALRKKADGGSEDFTLVAELTGKSSNIILVDDKGTVLDALKYFDPGTSVRAVVPGVTLSPLPPATAKGGGLIPKAEGESWNEAAERHYSELVAAEAKTLDRNSLGRVIREALKKARRKLDNLEGDRARAEGDLGARRHGELIMANLGRLKRGMKEALLTDYTVHPPAEVAIPLDEKLLPKENAERCFKRAKKAKTAIELLARRIPVVKEELEYLENLLYEWESMEKEDDIEELKRELVEEGYIKERKKKGATEAVRAEPVRRVRSKDGFEIIYGRSSTGNDLIVKKYASGEDIWMHAKGVPGSHVLIKVAGRGKELTRETIEEAAALAAFHSKASGAMKVEVLYTEARNVKKPRGAKPGLVTVKEYRTINVRPKGME